MSSKRRDITILDPHTMPSRVAVSGDMDRRRRARYSDPRRARVFPPPPRHIHVCITQNVEPVESLYRRDAIRRFDDLVRRVAYFLDLVPLAVKKSRGRTAQHDVFILPIVVRRGKNAASEDAAAVDRAHTGVCIEHKR